jgi:PEGA domain
MSATLASLIVVCSLLSTAVAQSNSPPSPSSQSQPANAQPTAPTKGFVLEDGTAVTLRLGRTLSSAEAHAGDRVDFKVAEEVSINRIVVILRDSPASGTVITAHKKRRMGRAGKLDVSIDSVQLADGEKVTLRAVKESQGGSHTGIMAGGMVATSLIVWPVAPVFLLMHGKDVTIPEGTEVTAYISGDVKLDLAKFQPAPLGPAPPVPATQQVSPASPAATPNAEPTDAPLVSPDQGAAAELEVSSSPDGADIEIDGNFVGSTPSTVGVAAGPHQLSVKKAGFKPWERKITVSSGHIKIDAALESQAN